MATTKDSEQRVAVPPPKKDGGGSNNTALKIILIIIGVVILLGLLAFVTFGWLLKSTVDKVYDSADISVNKDGTSVSITDDEGNTVASGASKELPDGFPSVVVILEPKTILSSSKIKTGDGQMWTVVTEVDGAPNDNFSKVKQSYEDDGWEVSTESQYDDYYSVSYKKDNLSASISVTTGDDEGKTQITYSIIESNE